VFELHNVRTLIYLKMAWKIRIFHDSAAHPAEIGAAVEAFHVVASTYPVPFESVIHRDMLKPAESPRILVLHCGHSLDIRAMTDRVSCSSLACCFS
jgi:hypothetical protein